MKTTLFLLLGLLLILPVQAEISPGHAKRRQAKSPEALTIKVLTVDTKTKRSLKGKTEHVTATAEVTGVARSAAGLKKGQIIKIEYQRFFATLPEPGVSPAPVLKKGDEHPAFLRSAKPLGVFEPDVFAYSFKNIAP